MPLHQRDFILRLIEQAGVALARLKAKLLGKAADAGEILFEAEQAQSGLLGPLWPAVRHLDAASAAMLVGEPRMLRAWIELLRVEAAAHELAGNADHTNRLTVRVEALELEARRLEAAEQGGPQTPSAGSGA